jgi:hypothetical protein
MIFHKASKKQAKLRMALIGPSGSGKTRTALAIAEHLVPGGRVALIDTEHGSASLYANLFRFDVVELDSYSVENYIAAIDEAERLAYDVLIIDSLSHAWSGKDGVLEYKDRLAAASSSKDDFGAWRKASPKHNSLVERMLSARLHLIATMRVKTEYVVERGADGKSHPRKVGLQPVQRDGVKYEFGVIADLDADHNFIVSKSRCDALTGMVVNKAGKEVADILRQWLSDGEPEVADARLQPSGPTVLDGLTEEANGNGAGATESQPLPPTSATWPDMKADLVARCEYYRDAGGQPNSARITEAAKALGYAKPPAGESNLREFAAKLEAYAHEQAADRVETRISA